MFIRKPQSPSPKTSELIFEAFFEGGGESSCRIEDQGNSFAVASGFRWTVSVRKMKKESIITGSELLVQLVEAGGRPDLDLMVVVVEVVVFVVVV